MIVLAGIVLCLKIVGAFSYDPCSSINRLDIRYNEWRNVHVQMDPNIPRCDQYIDEVWQRFVVANNDDEMPTYPVELGQCGTKYPIWANGTLPSSRNEGEKVVTACIHTEASICATSWTITVKYCDGFYVYLPKTPPVPCNMAYCVGVRGIATTTSPAVLPDPKPADPCSSINRLDIRYNEWRNVRVQMDPNIPRCDQYIDEVWQRFVVANNDDEMPTQPVAKGYCGTKYPIWAKDHLPLSSDDGEKDVVVCAHTEAGACSVSWTIKAKRCQGFYVYLFKPISSVAYCDMAYCIGVDAGTNRTSVLPNHTSTTTEQLPDGKDPNFTNIGKGEDGNVLNWFVAAGLLVSILILIVIAFLIALVIVRNKKNSAKVDPYWEKCAANIMSPRYVTYQCTAEKPTLTPVCSPHSTTGSPFY